MSSYFRGDAPSWCPPVASPIARHWGIDLLKDFSQAELEQYDEVHLRGVKASVATDLTVWRYLVTRVTVTRQYISPKACQMEGLEFLAGLPFMRVLALLKPAYDLELAALRHQLIGTLELRRTKEVDARLLREVVKSFGVAEPNDKELKPETDWAVNALAGRICDAWWTCCVTAALRDEIAPPRISEAFFTAWGVGGRAPRGAKVRSVFSRVRDMAQRMAGIDSSTIVRMYQRTPIMEDGRTRTWLPRSYGPVEVLSPGYAPPLQLVPKTSQATGDQAEVIGAGIVDAVHIEELTEDAVAKVASSFSGTTERQSLSSMQANSSGSSWSSVSSLFLSDDDESPIKDEYRTLGFLEL